MKFKKLKDLSEKKDEFLTVRITKAWLDRSDSSPGERTLFVEIEKDSEVITNSREREKHFKSVDSRWFEKQLRLWNNKDCKLIRVADRKHPLEVIVGDVCLVLDIEGKDYLLAFYRDIYPEGWVFPGGCSNSLEEIFNPRMIAIRELVEELLIADTFGRVYSFFNTEKLVRKKLVRLTLNHKNFVFPFIKPLFLKAGDAENLVVSMNGKEKYTKVNIAIQPKTATVSAIFFRKVVIGAKLSELRLFDGEEDKDGKLINRPIKLLDLENGSTKAIFISGKNILGKGWNNPRAKELANILQM